MDIAEKITLLPWQSTLLTCLAILTCLVFVILMGMLCISINSKSTLAKKKHRPFLKVLFVALLLLLLMTMTAGASFFVDAEFGLGPSILTGVSVVICLTTLSVMLKGLLDDRTKEDCKRCEYIAWWCYWWLCVIGFAVVVAAVLAGVRKIQG